MWHSCQFDKKWCCWPSNPSMGEILEKHLEEDALMGVFKLHQKNQSTIPSFFPPAFEEIAFNDQNSKLLPGKAELLLLFNLIKPLCFAWQKGKVEHFVLDTVWYNGIFLEVCVQVSRQWLDWQGLNSEHWQEKLSTCSYHLFLELWLFPGSSGILQQ